jgi:ABC-2 type transport system ATP-binding protein
MRVLVVRMLMHHVCVGLTMAEPRLEVHQLHFRHTIAGRIPLIRKQAVLGGGVFDCSFSINRGEILGLVGANGAGKTTLLRLLAGIHAPQKGNISVDGKDANTFLLRTKIGHMPEHIRWNGSKTLGEIMEEFCILSNEETTTASKLLSLVGLSDQRHDPVYQLSQGMRQRLSLGVALIGSPEILLLDEPFNGLDPIASASFQNMLKMLASKGVTIIISSHLVYDLRSLVDRIAIMHRGQLIEEGTMEDVSKKLGFYGLYELKGEDDLDVEQFFEFHNVVEHSKNGNSWALIVRDVTSNTIQTMLKNNVKLTSWTPFEPSLVDLIQSATGMELDEMSLEVKPQMMVPLRLEVNEDE